MPPPPFLLDAADAFALYLAPMSGFTDAALRTLCKEAGADMLVSEFVHAKAVLHDGDFIWKTLAFSPEQRPYGVQLFGDDPAAMAQAAQRVCARMRPDFIDLNFGCPSPRVTGSRAGSSLLRDLPRLEAIARAVVLAVGAHTPVTAKTRLGWDAEHIVVADVLERVQNAGVRALVVHGRTRAQGYAGAADWERIGALSERAKIPVVANGSIASAEDVRTLRRRFPRLKGAMIGRAALGNPWIFSKIKAELAGIPWTPPTLSQRWDTLLRYARLALADTPPQNAPLRPLHAALAAFTGGMPESRRLRAALQTVAAPEDLEALKTRHLSRLPL